MSRLYMRTNAEAHIYMDQRACTCGDIEFERQTAVMNDNGVPCSCYFGKCRTCGTPREFVFELPPVRRAAGNQVEFGGSDRSRLLDTGEWMAISEYYAKLDPGTFEDLDTARAALEEVIKFLPDGADQVPDDAFWSERGRAVREREPGRFRRARLAAVLDAYRNQLAKYDLTTIPVAWKHTGDAEFPYTADVRNRRFTIRINDFPAEPLYTLIAEGRELQDLEDWPGGWEKPAPPKALLDLLTPKRPVTTQHRNAGVTPQIRRLTGFLEARGGPMLPLLRAVETSNEARHYMDVSVLSRRWTLLLPTRPDVLAHLAPGLSLGELPPRPLLKVFIDGEQLRISVASAGAVAPDKAVDVAPEPAQAKWLETVTAMHGFGNGRISSRLRFLDQPRGTIDVLYDARPPADNEQFAASLDQIACRVGVPAAQRELAKAYQTSTNGAAVVVTTACMKTGPAPELAFMYGNTTWDEAVRLCRLVASEDAAREAAAMLGTVAATLELDATSGVQFLIRPDGPDVSVLVTLR